MSKPVSPTNDDDVLWAIIRHFLNFDARASNDARWFVGILPADLQAFFRDEFMEAIKLKAGNDATKTRKLFLSLGKTARFIFGDEYQTTKHRLDAESKAARAGVISRKAGHRNLTEPVTRLSANCYLYGKGTTLWRGASDWSTQINSSI